MTYWIDLFTGTTWDEFRKAGATITGFSSRRAKTIERVKAGDVLLCYLTGVMRWVGALEVIGPSSDSSRIWKQAEYPARLKVRPMILLNPEHGVPMQELLGKVDFFQGAKPDGKFKGFVRTSPNRFRRSEDGELIVQLLRQAEREPITRPVDARKLARTPLYRVPKGKGKEKQQASVTVPDAEDTATPVAEPAEAEAQARASHSEIQYYLLRLGAKMGLNVWVAKNDRSRIHHGNTLGTMPNMVDDLPVHFDEATYRTIELIDVLWLKGNSIEAAFEVESTTSIYSGLLRMSDLLALQPNIDIDLYLVAPDERRSKVEQELLRPTFNLREQPLAEVCGFLSFSKLIEQVNGIEKLGLASALKSDFLKKAAEYFPSSDEGE